MPPEIITPDTDPKQAKAADPAKLDTLKELRTALVEEISKGTGANTERIEKLSEKWNEVATKVDELIAARAKLIELPGQKHAGELPEWAKNFNLLRTVQGWRSDWAGDLKNAPERGPIIDYTRAVNSAGTDTDGGFAIAPQVMSDRFIPALEAKSVLLASGAELVDDLVGSPVDIPKITGVPDAYWVAEAEAITETKMSFGQIQMTPKGLASIVPVTHLLLKQTSNRVNNMISSHLVRALARKLDLAGFKGTHGKQPLGMLNQKNLPTSIDGTGVLQSTGATQEITDFLEAMIGTLEDGDALDGQLTWFMHPAVRRAFYGVKDADGRPLLFEGQAGSGLSRPTSFYGYPFQISTQLEGGGNDRDLIFTDASRIMVGQWGPMVIDTSQEASDAYAKRLTLIRAYIDVDIAVQHTEAIATAVNLGTA